MQSTHLPTTLHTTHLAQIPQAIAPLPQSSTTLASNPWVYVSGILALGLAGAIAVQRNRLRRLQKQLYFEDLKKQELKRKLKLALTTITRMEQNPDLIHSRDFNLDYLRMRMAEDIFNFAILNQIKVKIKDRIAAALRSKPTEGTVVGIASTGRQVDELFDVEYTVGEGATQQKRILFRVQIRMVKLPAQATSQTIQQLIDCMEAFLSPQAEEDYWQPTIQGRLAHMEWDQKAKPTPLLVLEQTQDGTNVTFRTRKGAALEAVL